MVYLLPYYLVIMKDNVSPCDTWSTIYSIAKMSFVINSLQKGNIHNIIASPSMKLS